MNIISGSAPAHEQVAGTIRNLIAKQLHVKLKRVTDGARFREDLRADWLDRLELMIAIEDQFAGLEIGDDDADRIVAVGDLIRFVEGHPSWYGAAHFGRAFECPRLASAECGHNL